MGFSQSLTFLACEYLGGGKVKDVIIYRDVFKTQSNIYDGALCENS